MPKIIPELLQGSSEWLELKFKTLGCSSAPVIMNESLYETPYQLWQRLLLKKSIVVNGAMQRGKELESTARHAYQDELREPLICPTIQCEMFPWMIYSSDGMTQDMKRGCEIKCPNRDDHELAYKGIIPQQFIGQLQAAMYIMGWNEIDYISYNPNCSRSYVKLIVPRDQNYIDRYILRAIEFWRCIQEFEEPEKTQKDYRPPSDNFLKLEEDYASLDNQIKLLEKEKERVREEMIADGEGNNVWGHVVKMTKIISKGRVDYNNIPELNDIDLDQYRKQPTTSYRFTNTSG